MDTSRYPPFLNLNIEVPSKKKLRNEERKLLLYSDEVLYIPLMVIVKRTRFSLVWLMSFNSAIEQKGMEK